MKKILLSFLVIVVLVIPNNYVIALKNGIWKDVAIETTISIASSDFMKYQYRKILDR